MLKVLENGKAPTKGSKYSAAVDLYASEDVVIGAGETKLVGLGVCIDFTLLDDAILSDVQGDMNLFDIQIDSEEFLEYKDFFIKSHYLALHPRSSLRAKGLISNVGVVDLDFCGVENEIKIIIHNPTTVSYEMATDTSGHIECDNNFTIKKGDKIAQIILMEHKTFLLGVSSKNERVGGFGSSGN